MKIATVARAGLRVLVALASVGALIATGVAWSVQQHVTTTIVTSDAVTPHPVLIGQAFTALLVGLDARTDANGNPLPPALLDAIHAGPDEGQLHTDTIILLHVPALPGEPAVAVSIPRDSYVALADGSGKHKINSAYNRGLVAARAGAESAGSLGSRAGQARARGGPQRTHRHGRVAHRNLDRPLRRDQPRRFRGAHRRPRWRAGVPQQARARHLLRRRPARGLPDRERPGGAGVRAPAPRPRRRRPGPDRPPAGVHRRAHATAAERGRAHRPGHALAAAGRRDPPRRDRQGLGRAAGRSPGGPGRGRRPQLPHHPDRPSRPRDAGGRHGRADRPGGGARLRERAVQREHDRRPAPRRHRQRRRPRPPPPPLPQPPRPRPA